MIESILSEFLLTGLLKKTARFGSGLINDTYLCEYIDSGRTRRYILQRINTAVFQEPERVMANVELVTGHILKKREAEGVSDPASQTPVLIHTRRREPYLRAGNGTYWRMYHFIESGRVYDTVQGRSHAYEVGRGIGMFQALLSDLAPGRLADTLPGFHHTPVYLSAFDAALQADTNGRASGVRAEADFIASRRFLAPLLVDRMNSGELPVRVVHNDPKVNNVMIDTDTGKALCMLDLDTVKPGIVHFDFGDCARSVANPGGEDADLADVSFDRELFKAVADGFLQEAGGFLTRTERDMLPASVKVITFELGLRFLADYLRGDTYFKTGYPGHNLHRARVQFRLLQSIEAAEKRAGIS